MARFKFDRAREDAIKATQAAEARLHEAEQWRSRVTDMGQVEPALRELDDARRDAAAAWKRVHEEYERVRREAGHGDA